MNQTIFVQADGGSDLNAGDSAAAPVRTLGAALLRAESRGPVTIALQPGVYAEDVTLGSSFSMNSIVGAVTPQWQRDCDPTARDRTVIATPSPEGMLISGNTGIALSLGNLTVRSADATQPSQSSYAVRVLGSRVNFFQVVLIAGRGGDGGVAGMVPASAGTVSCNTFTSCALGASGTPGPPGTPSDGGSFGSGGFLPGHGGTGGPGSPGQSGPAGPDGGTRLDCVTSCAGAVPCSNGDLFCGATTAPLTGERGRCGCGGNGGEGGLSALGGGASIALFVAGPSGVTITSSRLQSTAAGHGGVPSMGGLGAAGAAGTPGAPLPCQEGPCGRSMCNGVCAPVGPMSTVPGGAVGGPGGTGGSGGPGGAGAGGPSIPLVTVGIAPQNVTSSGLTFIPGPGGSAVGGARPGLVLNQLVLP